MVKAITYTLVAIAVCIGVFIFTELYLTKQFNEFTEALETLYEKIDDETATVDDGYALREMWYDKKSKLHVLVPHNDISYIDYWLNEACGLLQNGNYELALGKIEVLREISKALPDAYKLSYENIF
ncbi:MAG: DUF4363 family protein [Clostridia bacterium]|nr:DUF4363 family protein [Clostridia bacterium]